MPTFFLLFIYIFIFFFILNKKKKWESGQKNENYSKITQKTPKNTQKMAKNTKKWQFLLNFRAHFWVIKVGKSPEKVGRNQFFMKKF